MEDKKRQSVFGTVERVSGNETIRVVTKVTKVHPIYRKRYTQTRHILAHNPGNKAQVGDGVTIVSCRPISKQKSWIVQD